jgi:hypothetical protein
MIAGDRRFGFELVRIALGNLRDRVDAIKRSARLGQSG